MGSAAKSGGRQCKLDCRTANHWDGRGFAPDFAGPQRRPTAKKLRVFARYAAGSGSPGTASTFHKYSRYSTIHIPFGDDSCTGNLAKDHGPAQGA